MNKDNKYSYTSLPEPIPITEQEWPEGTLPLVTTRTITYMHEPFIRECIEGILMQKTTFPVEVVIHDDASTDKTAEIVREYQVKHPRLIKAICQKENQYSKPGKGTLRKDIQDATHGKYIALCEGDDYWTDPLKLQKQVEFLEQNEEYSACFTNANIKNEMENSFKKYVTYLNEGSVPLKEILLMGGYIFPTASLIFKKNNLNYYQSELSKDLSGDTALIIILANSGKVYFMNNNTCIYRRWSGGLFSSIADNPKKVAQWKIKRIRGYRKLKGFLEIQYHRLIDEKISNESLFILENSGSVIKYFYLLSLTRSDFLKWRKKQINILKISLLKMKFVRFIKDIIKIGNIAE